MHRRLISGSTDETIKIWDTQGGVCLSTLGADRSYERLSITGVTGLSGARKASLKTLGAFELA